MRRGSVSLATMTKPFTISLTEAQKEHLRATATREQMTIDQVLADLVQRQIDYDVWFADKVQEGLDALNRGEFLTHEDVAACAKVRRDDLIAKHGGR